MNLPSEVFISKDETLPRELVATCARSGCRRCSGAGWFRFAGTESAWICPCAQKRVYERTGDAKQKSKPPRPLGAIQRAAGQMVAAGRVPASVLCGLDVAATLRSDPEAMSTPATVAVDHIAGEFTIASGSTEILPLRVLPDDDAPENFARVFTDDEFVPYLRELFQKQAHRRDEARAKDEIDRARAALVASGDA